MSSKWRPRLLAVGVAALVLVTSACSGRDAERATAGAADVSCVDLASTARCRRSRMR